MKRISNCLISILLLMSYSSAGATHPPNIGEDIFNATSIDIVKIISGKSSTNNSVPANTYEVKVENDLKGKGNLRFIGSDLDLKVGSRYLIFVFNGSKAYIQSAMEVIWEKQMNSLSDLSRPKEEMAVIGADRHGGLVYIIPGLVPVANKTSITDTTIHRSEVVYQHSSYRLYDVVTYIRGYVRQMENNEQLHHH